MTDQTEREALGRVIADYQACGHCDGTCGACLGEADAILAALPSLGYRLIDPDDDVLAEKVAKVLRTYPLHLCDKGCECEDDVTASQILALVVLKEVTDAES